MTRTETQLPIRDRVQTFFAPHWSETRAAVVLRPMQEFIQRSTSSGIVLFLSAIIALVLANSPLAADYTHVLESYISFSVGPFMLRETVLHWINDGLMAIFFFVVGLEIKRELLAGELSNVRAALLPVGAALGGALLPAVLYSALNARGVGAAGWGVPMATDIAFALGVLALLGDRVPFALKIFLTAVAIIDDLLAVLVIAFFYSSGINLAALGVGFALLALLMAANMLGIRSTIVYMVVGMLVWLALLHSGIHATIAGVLVALTIPARTRIDPVHFLARSRELLRRFENSNLEPTLMLGEEAQQSAVLKLEHACEAVQAPLQKLEHRLYPWVSFGIMPLFALANAGVSLSFGALHGETLLIPLGIGVGLLLGKPLGLLAACWLMVRAGVAELPAGVAWRHMVGAGCLAGIGFTMSLFIAALGFGDAALLQAAKLGILGASVVAGALGYTLLRQMQPLTEQEAATDTFSAAAAAE